MSSDMQSLTQLIARVNRRIESALSVTLKVHGLSLDHFRVLDALAEEDGRTMSDLAAQAFVDPPTMTKLVDRLASAGSVYRAPAPGDRRKVRVFISDHGRALHQRCVDPVSAFEAELLAEIDSGDRRDLARILQTLAH